jgi:DNA-binding NtrC family response regulator/tetratricopeptide (TPR) repeat protein
MAHRRSEPPRRGDQPRHSARDLILQAEAAFEAGDVDGALALSERSVEQADKHPDGSTRSQARRILARVLLHTGAAERAKEVTEEARRISLAARDRAEEALSELGLAEIMRARGDYAQALRHAVRAQARASRSGDPETLRIVVSEYALLLSRVGDAERAHELFDEVLSAGPFKSPYRALRTLYNAATADRMAGRFSKAFARLDAADALAAEHGLSADDFLRRTARAQTYFDVGAIKEAAREAERIALTDGAPPWQRAQLAALSALIRLSMGGRPEAVERSLEHVSVEGLEQPTRFAVEHVRALALLSRGNRLEAERVSVSLMTLSAKGGTRGSAAQALGIAARAGNREAWLLRWLGALALTSGGVAARLEHEAMAALVNEPEPIGGLARSAVSAIRARLIARCPAQFRAELKTSLRQVETRVLALREARHTESALMLEVPTLRAKEDLGIAGTSVALTRALALTSRAAKSNASIVINGETGSGKELFAQLVHQISPRKNGPFVAINCAAIPEQLLEAELFGYERGAFTGADRARRGLFVEAEGGTLFMDEVGEMSASMQAKLLRVLEDGEVRPIGGTKDRKVNVRVVAATHRDLSALVAARTFREDLFYRLAAIVVRVPPLRDRLEDLPAVAQALLARDPMTKHFRLEVPAIAALAEHTWPGNVRELSNVLRAAAAMAEENVIERPALEAAINARTLRDPRSSATTVRETTLAALRNRHKAELRELVSRALLTAKGNKLRAAQALGVSRQGLYRVLE